MSSPAQTSLPAVFRLLVPATEDTQSVIYVGGRNWVLTEAIPFPPTHSTPAYTAISYACGLGRSPHPITGYEPMSDRTLGAVDAALLVHGAEALWIDSFCVPMDRLERAECLRRMGAIYARAAKVVVVLSEPCSAMLEQINASTRVDESALMALEADDWISRVWTYHEVVNNDYVYFVAAGGRVSVAAADLLRELTYALDDFKKAHALDSFELAGLFPRLNGFDNLMLDWKMWGYLERSAYQVMTTTHRRHATHPEDHFHAVFGAIATSSSAALPSVDLHPAEAFMQLCELAGDYSFLYTTAPRDRTQGRRWRPEAQTPFEVVLPWPSYGKGQHATALPTHLQLEDMWLLTPCPLRPDAKDFLLRWLKTSPDALCGEDLSARVLRRLRAAGFAGCGEIVELESGYFFPHESLRDTEVKVAIATGVRTTFGAVALGLVRRVSLFEIYGVGVFVGRIRGEGAPINVA